MAEWGTERVVCGGTRVGAWCSVDGKLVVKIGEGNTARSHSLRKDYGTEKLSLTVMSTDVFICRVNRDDGTEMFVFAPPKPYKNFKSKV